MDDLDFSAMSFETCEELLRDIIAQMEQGTLPLNDMVAQYEKGQALAKRMEDILSQSKLKLEILSDDGTTKPFLAEEP